VNDAARVIQQAFKKSIRDVGRGMGTGIGKAMGKPGRGAKMGKAIAARVSKIMGQGDYTTNQGDVAQNSLFKGNSAASASFSNHPGGVRVQHREFIQDITNGAVAGAFANNTFIVNPGLSFVFPYLAQLASNFEQYKFHGLCFEFISSVSPYQATGLGTYAMAMAYNAMAPSFTSKPAMENSDYAISARMDGCAMYGVECAPNTQAQEYYYIRAPGVATPVNLTDLGLMQLATVTPLPALAVLGEMWVTYDVELIRPRIALERYGYAHLTCTGVSAVNPLGTALTKSAVYGALLGTVRGNGTAAALNTGTQLSFPNASVGDIYAIQFNWTGTAATAAAYPSIAFTNMKAGPALYANGTANFTQPELFATCTAMSFTVVYEVTAEQPSIPLVTLGPLGSYPAAAVLDIIVTDLGNGWTTSTLVGL